jgi:hypothetical protein
MLHCKNLVYSNPPGSLKTMAGTEAYSTDSRRGQITPRLREALYGLVHLRGSYFRQQHQPCVGGSQMPPSTFRTQARTAP